MPCNLLETCERVGVFIEDHRRRGAAKYPLVARILIGGEAVDASTVSRVDPPSADAIAQVLTVAYTVVKARANGSNELGGKRKDGEGS